MTNSEITEESVKKVTHADRVAKRKNLFSLKQRMWSKLARKAAKLQHREDKRQQTLANKYKKKKAVTTEVEEELLEVVDHACLDHDHDHEEHGE